MFDLTHAYQIPHTKSFGICKSAKLQGFDESEMSATAIISTPDFDREGDSVNPMGGDFSEYMLNPIVYWDHGLDHTLPIGKSQDSKGRLLIWPSEKQIIGKCLFSQKDKFASDVFGLVCEDIIRATSIRYTPTSRPKRKTGGMRYESWKLDEWSWTGLGMNPFAVREVIAKNFKLGGRLSEQLHPSIMKSFKAYAKQFPTRSVFKGFGFQDPETHVTDHPGYDEQNFEDELQDGYKMSDDKTPDGQEPENSNPEDDRIEGAGGEESSESGEEAEEESEYKMTSPYGAQVMRAAYTKMAELTGDFENAFQGLEHPKVKECLQGVKNACDEQLTVMKNAFGENYPDDGEQLGEFKMDQAEKTKEEQEQQLKSFLAADESKRARTRDLLQRLSSLSKAKSATGKLAKELFDVLHDATIEANKPKLKSASEKKLDELEKKFQQKKEQIESLTPASKR